MRSCSAAGLAPRPSLGPQQRSRSAQASTPTTASSSSPLRRSAAASASVLSPSRFGRQPRSTDTTATHLGLRERCGPPPQRRPEQVELATRRPASPASLRHVSSFCCDPSSRHVLLPHASTKSVSGAASAAAAAAPACSGARAGNTARAGVRRCARRSQPCGQRSVAAASTRLGVERARESELACTSLYRANMHAQPGAQPAHPQTHAPQVPTLTHARSCALTCAQRPQRRPVVVHPTASTTAPDLHLPPLLSRRSQLRRAAELPPLP